jgi:tetratricopeptide (TPR) repeat protein
MDNTRFSLEEAKNNLLKAATYLAEKVSGSDGHAEAMKTIVPLYLEKNEVDLAAELSDNVQDPFVRDYLLMLTAEKCAEIDDDDYAFQLCEAIDNETIRIEALEKIALQKIQKGEFNKAFQIAEMLDTAERIYGEAALKYAESGEIEKGQNLIEKIWLPSEKVLALQNLSEILLKQNETEEAVNILIQTCNFAEEIDYEIDAVKALQETAEIFIRIGRRDKAIETLEKARQKAEKLQGMDRENFLSLIALRFLHAGSLELADRTLDLVSDKAFISSALLGFANHFFENGDFNGALETLEEAYQILRSQHEKEIRSSKERFQLFRLIAIEFAKFGKFERAIEIAQEIADETEQTTALSQIAQILALQNENEKAQQSIRAISQEDGKMFALIAVSDAKASLNLEDEALHFLNLAYELIEAVPQVSSRAIAYNELAERFLKHGKLEKAREILFENLQTIVSIRDESLGAIALALCSKIYEKAGFSLSESEKTVISRLLLRSR